MDIEKKYFSLERQHLKIKTICMFPYHKKAVHMMQAVVAFLQPLKQVCHCNDLLSLCIRGQTLLTSLL